MNLSSSYYNSQFVCLFVYLVFFFFFFCFFLFGVCCFFVWLVVGLFLCLFSNYSQKNEINGPNFQDLMESIGKVSEGTLVH